MRVDFPDPDPPAMAATKGFCGITFLTMELAKLTCHSLGYHQQ